jgi:NitT/TauT family transport system substrate-binding protein
MKLSRRAFTGGAALAGAGLVAGFPHIVRAQSLIPVKFTLDWAFQGPQSVYLYALEKGFYRDEGLDVKVDRGFGSGDVPVKVATGAYDIGIADLSPTIRLKLENPTSDLITPFVITEATQLAAMTTKRSGITTPKQLEGRKIAAPETDAGRQLFPAFAKAAGIDASKISWITVTPQLRETMLAQGQADAISGFMTSGVFGLRAAGVAPGDIISFKYADAGVRLYSTSVIVRRSYAQANPRVVTGMVKAIARAQIAAFKDLDGAVASLAKADPLTDRALEKERLAMNYEFVRTANVLKDGLSPVTEAGMQEMIDTMKAAFNVTTPLKASDVYDPTWLPDRSLLKFT